MSHCQDCGCKVYSGACVNCHESIFIEQQYHDLGDDTPAIISNEANKARKDIAHKRMIKDTM